MKNESKTRLVRAAAVVLLLSLVAAPNASADQSTEKLLSSSGFKSKSATTTEQQRQLNILPEGKVSIVHQNGKTYYVYADRKHKQIYVGNKDQYQKFDGELKRQPDADAMVYKIYSRRGHPVEVREFHEWGPLGE
jgi:hypothetical protein